MQCLMQLYSSYTMPNNVAPEAQFSFETDPPVINRPIRHFQPRMYHGPIDIDQLSTSGPVTSDMPYFY